MSIFLFLGHSESLFTSFWICFKLCRPRLQEERKKIVERNEELATENLSLKPQLEEKQQELIELVRQYKCTVCFSNAKKAFQELRSFNLTY